MAQKKVTKTIAGHTLTLEEGVTYVASIHLSSLNNDNTNIRICEIGKLRAKRLLRQVSLGEAKRFINTFNNRRPSHRGRIW